MGTSQPSPVRCRPGSPANLGIGAVSFSSLVALLCTEEAIYLSGPGSLWKMDLKGGTPQLFAVVPLPWLYRQAARWHLSRRLGRVDVRELIQTPSGDFLGIIRREIIAINRDSGEIRSVFEVNDGGRPKGFALTPSGHIFVGEYWGNPGRQPLRIWASTDGGENWELAHTLPAGSAKHIHNIIWDPYRRGLWILTGDGEGECALLFTGDEFKTVTELIRGGQMVRACRLFCEPDGIFYATDSERASNWFVQLDVESGKLHKIQPLPGSCIYAASFADQHWLSTSVEPSHLERKPALWSSSDLRHWTKRVEFIKDCWPGEYFGFGSIFLPRVQGSCPLVVFSAIAVKHHDLSTFVVKPDSLPSNL